MEDKRARTRRERERGEKRKEKRKKEPYVFLLFFSHARPAGAGRALLSPLFFLLSLPLRNASTSIAARKVSSLLLSLEISPGPATRQFPSPDSKEITLDAASCRCGRGEKRTKEDAFAWGFNCVAIAQKPSRSQHPATGLLSSQTLPLVMNGTRPSTSSKSRENIALFLQSRRRDVIWLWATRHRLVRFLCRRDFKRKKNKTLTCAFGAEQSRTIPTSSGSTAALNRMAEALKKRSKGERGEKIKRTKKVAAMQPTSKQNCAANCSVFSFETVFLLLFFCAFPLPSSSFLGQPRRLPSFLPLLYVLDGGRDKEDEGNVAAMQQTVQSSRSKTSSCFSSCAALASSLFPYPRPTSATT